jgi:limonene-1,2-epoxide hydrolase
MPHTSTTAVHLTPSQIVESFFAALQANDLERALSWLGNDVEYQNYPLPADRGKAATTRTLRAFNSLASEFEVQMHNIAEHGNIVLTERTDILRGPLMEMEFWVCGTFEIREGKIVLWRDRADAGMFLYQLMTSPLRRLFSKRGKRSPSAA